MLSGGANSWHPSRRLLFLFSILSDLNPDMWGLILKLMLHTGSQTKFKSFGNNSDDRNETRTAILES